MRFSRCGDIWPFSKGLAGLGYRMGGRVLFFTPFSPGGGGGPRFFASWLGTADTLDASPGWLRGCERPPRGLGRPRSRREVASKSGEPCAARTAPDRGAWRFRNLMDLARLAQGTQGATSGGTSGRHRPDSPSRLWQLLQPEGVRIGQTKRAARASRLGQAGDFRISTDDVELLAPHQKRAERLANRGPRGSAPRNWTSPARPRHANRVVESRPARTGARR